MSAAVSTAAPIRQPTAPVIRYRIARVVIVALVCAASATPLAAQSPGPSPDQALARDIFAELVGINTTFHHGNTTPAAKAVARRLLTAGFPAADVQVIGPNGDNQNIVGRLRGTGKRRPILLLAHLDVVEALRADWSLDPFTLTKRDGYFYGRGTSDIKDMAAIFTAAMIRMKHEGFTPDRDIILALTSGEEDDDAYNGVQWLLAHHHDFIDAAYCINGDGGEPLAINGKVFARNVQASEKVYLDLQLEVHNRGGHSSQPVPDNAIYHLAAALTRISALEFPMRLNEVTRAYFERAASAEAPEVGADMKLVAEHADTSAARRLAAHSAFFNAQLRTTCVATRLEGGHANNALPQMARAIVNCRMLPDDHQDDVVAAIRNAIADTAVALTVVNPAKPSPPSPLVPDVLGPIEQVSAEFFPGAPVVPSMETGATDGLYLRNAGMPVYGVSGVAIDANDVRAHGRDERIRVAAFYSGVDYTYRLVRALAGGRP
jgi:acetylornithine deacetylase/succinyl-diaminopimelate desuccinylase-like protein